MKGKISSFNLKLIMKTCKRKKDEKTEKWWMDALPVQVHTGSRILQENTNKLPRIVKWTEMLMKLQQQMVKNWYKIQI